MRIFILMLALTLAPGTAQGQESTTEPEPGVPLETPPDSSQNSSQEDTEAENTREKSAVGADTPDIFVPSEDISEDISVAFPVDI